MCTVHKSNSLLRENKKGHVYNVNCIINGILPHSQLTEHTQYYLLLLGKKIWNKLGDGMYIPDQKDFLSPEINLLLHSSLRTAWVWVFDLTKKKWIMENNNYWFNGK